MLFDLDPVSELVRWSVRLPFSSPKMALITQKRNNIGFFIYFCNYPELSKACHYWAHPENKKEQWHEMPHDK